MLLSSSQAPSRRPACGGFALVIALSLMAFVLLLLLSITTLVRVESQSAQIGVSRLQAQQNALLSLHLALGELQQAAGPDQRVTANADILTDANTLPDAARRWLGVWDTSDYNPAEPENKTFIRWLVSRSAASGNETTNAAATAVETNALTIFRGVDADGAADSSNDVVVEKVELPSSALRGQSYYAYWVEDQSVKADLAWHEGSFDGDDERQQTARLTSLPGVDYAVFASDAGSPFFNQVEHPLTQGDANNSWLENINKVVSSATLPLLTGSNQDSAADWLKASRHDITFGSHAVLCDVKNGGLRRDLSLAFEMDGAAEAENATLFNQQEGEFVGGPDSLAAPQIARGMPIQDRYLYRDYLTAGNDFSGDITVAENVGKRGARSQLVVVKRLRKFV